MHSVEAGLLFGMSKEFEAEVKKTKPGAANSTDKEAQEPDLKDATEDASRDENAGEDSPMKTVGGTPIIEKPSG